MDTSYTLTDARNQLGQVVNEVRHGGKTVEITDHGTPVAALIPIGLLDYFHDLEDQLDLARAQEAKAGTRRLTAHSAVAAKFGLNPDGTPKR